jgi:hypothetical protein
MVSAADSLTPDSGSPASMSNSAGRTFIRERVGGTRFFLCAFIVSCFIFWWLPSFLFRVVVHQADEIENSTVAISILALICFIAGYLFPAFGRRPAQYSQRVLDTCGDFAYRATILLALPALILAVQFWRTHQTMTYGYVAVDQIPFLYQAVLYTQLFLGFMYLGSADPKKEGWRRILFALTLVILPRLIISLHWGRFFLAQAIIPALLIAIARGWVRITAKRMLQITLLTLGLIFVPAMTRGDFSGEQKAVVDWFANGSSLRLMQSDADLNLSGYCNPFLVSLTSKSFPYGILGICVLDMGKQKNLPATLDRILTINLPYNTGGIVSGTGSNYLLELYLFGGLAAVFAGSAFFGFTCRQFMRWIGVRSLFSGIWAECLTRALLAPRGNLSYVYERIPSLILTTLFVVFIVWAGSLMSRENSGLLVKAIPD